MKRVRPRVEINRPELDQGLEQARQSPRSDPDYQKLKDALHLLVGRLQPARSTEKTRAAPADGDTSPAPETTAAEKPAPPGHGRNGVAACTGARKIAIPHSRLQAGAGGPACEKGKVYRQKDPQPLIRIIGQAPPAAAVYEGERFRRPACGQVFTAAAPEEVGLDQYGETTGASIAQLKYGKRRAVLSARETAGRCRPSAAGLDAGGDCRRNRRTPHTSV